MKTTTTTTSSQTSKKTVKITKSMIVAIIGLIVMVINSIVDISQWVPYVSEALDAVCEILIMFGLIAGGVTDGEPSISLEEYIKALSEKDTVRGGNTDEETPASSQQTIAGDTKNIAVDTPVDIYPSMSPSSEVTYSAATSRFEPTRSANVVDPPGWTQGGGGCL